MADPISPPFNPITAVYRIGTALQGKKRPDPGPGFSAEIQSLEQRNPEAAAKIEADLAARLANLTGSARSRAVSRQRMIEAARIQARRTPGVDAAPGIPSSNPAGSPVAVFGFVDTGRPLPTVVRPDVIPPKVPPILKGLGRLLWPVALLEMGTAVIRALEKRGKEKTEREAQKIFERDDAEMGRIRREAEKQRTLVVRAGKIILPKGPTTRVRTRTKPAIEPARPKVPVETKPGTAPAVPRPQRAPRRAAPGRKPAVPARQPTRPRPTRPATQPAQRVGRIIKRAADLGRVLDLIGRPTRARLGDRPIAPVGRIELPLQPAGPSTSLLDRATQLDRSARTQEKKCVCEAPKRKPGICRQGYFKETPRRTQYIEWSRRKCITPNLPKGT